MNIHFINSTISPSSVSAPFINFGGASISFSDIADGNDEFDT